jgi:exodeoxyribonuclease V gamma subunit
LESNGIQLAETLTGIRADQHGHRLRLRLQASALMTDEGPAWHQLLRDWPAHLLAQLAAPTSTRILGPGTDLVLRPLPAATAETLLVQLLADYVHGLTELPPLACRTGLAALVLAEGGRANPRAVYEGHQERGGERDEHPGYARFWPSYADLSADGRLGLLSDRLYRPLIAHLRAHQDD